jgi:hypothetical protein
MFKQKRRVKMTVYLLNSAVMPTEGTYITKKIDRETFVFLVWFFIKLGYLVSYLGYEQNVSLIEKWTGFRVSLKRSELKELEDGDILLIMKLKYRVQDPTKKGEIVDEDDFEFYVSKYVKSIPSKIKVFEIEL